MASKEQVCNKCKELKPITDFYLRTYTKVPETHCKVCRRAYNKEYKRRPKARKAIKEYQQEYGKNKFHFKVYLERLIEEYGPRATLSSVHKKEVNKRKGNS